MFEDLVPEGATAARQQVPRPPDTSDKDFAVFESEVRIGRSEIDVTEGRITKEDQQAFATALREKVRELQAQ